MSSGDGLNHSLVPFEEDRTLVAVIDMSLSSWVIFGLVPGFRRRPEKKLGADEAGLLSLLYRWRDEAERHERSIERICVGFKADRDGFWLARWLDRQGIEAQVIHASSIPVKQEQHRAKTDRLDCRLLMRTFIGWLRGEAEHRRMVVVPSIEAEDAKTPHRERVARSRECTKVINRMKATLARLGIRDFKPDLKKAANRLDELRLPTGEAALLQTLRGVETRLGKSGLRQVPAMSRRSCSKATATVSAPGPRPRARSMSLASPTMPPSRAKCRAGPLRNARMTSKPLIVA